MLERLSYTLTIPQESIWDVERFYRNSSYANLSMTVVISNNVNLDLLEEAVNIIIQQHEALRLRIEEHEGKPRQYVSSFSKQTLERLDYSSPGDWNKFVDWQKHQTEIPLNRFNADLYYFALVRLSDAKTALYFKLHHHISDAWTITLVIREILNTYKDLVNHVPLSLEQKPSYTDYIREDIDYRNSQKFEESKVFWQHMYETVPEFTHLKERVQGSVIRARRKTVRLSPHLTEDITRLSNEFKVSGFIIFFAALSLYISKTTFKHDLVIGTPVLNRANYQQKSMVGMFICNLPFRITINPKWDFITYLHEITKVWKQLLKNQRYPYQEILKDFRKKHNHTGALTDVFLSYQNAKFEVEDIDFESFWNFNGQEINTLSVHVSDWKDDGALRLDYDYLIEALTEPEVEQIHNYLITLLKDAISNPSKTLAEISLLTSQEKKTLISELNLNDQAYPKDKTIHQLIEEQVEKTPEQIALIVNEERLTYWELNERANQLANALRRKGVTPNSIVGIMVNRSPELMIGILGVLKAGGSYLPIDPKYPIGRVEELLRDSRTQLILTSQALCSEKEEIGRLRKKLVLDQIYLDDPTVYIGSATNPITVNKPSDLAYVIYTSGSEGKPKGVMIEHRSVNNLIYALYEKLHFLEHKAIVSLTTVSFDIFVMETLLPLSQGLCVVMTNEEEQQIPTLLFDLIKKHEIEMLQATPSKIQSLLRDPHCSEGLSPLSEIFIGGERLSEAVLKQMRKVAPLARIYNMYGPTETTVWSTFKELTQADQVTVGSPIANTQIFILDKNKELVPVGIPGEIYIGGDGLARGYLNREDLTKEKFVPHPFNQGKRVYITGDLGRWTTEGEIEHLGRNDDQVKIRGFRIELGEIEKRLLEHESLLETVVISREDGKSKPYLCAYLVGDSTCSVSDLREHLGQLLPDYMIPSRFVWLDAIPLTPNAKVDKRALPDPSTVSIVQDSASILPRDSIEEELSVVWSGVLDVEQVGIDDNFFVLGGDSLAIIEVLTGIWFREWDLSAQDFYDYPTIRQLSEKVRGTLSGLKESELSSEEFPSIDLELIKTQPSLLPIPLGNVLLTGATGFLGMHLIWELLRSTSSTIYCLVRGQESELRLKRLLEFYFSGSFEEKDFSRIRGVNGDISLEKFGLSNEDYIKLGETIGTVIHSAGLVKHYGSYSEFDKVNVLGTQQVIKFCQTFTRPMNHISTVSIAGNQIVNAASGKRSFSETEFYIGQNYRDNLYIRSKFEAEVQILKAITSGLRATIFRVGILTGRYTDGHFQVNIHENAFYQKLKSLLELKAIPQDQLQQKLEFTPVDACARGIINIIGSNTLSGRVFHMFNHNTITIEELINILYTQGRKVKPVDKVLFHQLIEQHLENKQRDSLNGFVLDLTKNDTAINIQIQSDITQVYLADTGFKWPEVTADYLKNIVKYMEWVGFLQQTI